MSNDIQPEIRFPGFTEDWEQRKFGEMLVNLEAGVSVNSSDYDTGYFILKTSAIKMGNIDLLEVKSIVSEEVARAKTPLIKNSIIISRMNTPELVGASGLVRESIDNIFLPDRLWQGQVAGNFSPEWLIQSINIAANIKKIRDLATGTSGSMKNISKKSMLDLIINVPTLEEQQKIGSFFKQLDDVISLHQLKLDLLKEQKKGFLQKMFPKNGAKVPEIRFPGFTKDWEERKLGDVFSERSERSSEGELISVTINSGVIKASELDRKDNSSDNKSNYKKVEVGDIAYNSMRMWQGASGYSSYEGILSPAYTVIIPKEGTDSKFFAYDFKRYDMIQTFKRNSQGLTSDTWNLKFPTLKLVKIMVPSIEEQKQIAAFFERLDNTIALHERELDVLKETKKGFLQKMFV
ncbi:restriction endonuclease subunit S [Enterococcus faecium]|uniref:restriction endonuclease subunit S n=1 Tax=Enterococcus faecium TaxID=1352 RepID=UPI002414222D|nr:restriction endonuclease subunit S [Enterococcus faecium]MDG4581498.1 restriction endonuclease subunit S [Enterococcus faecium]